MPLPINCPNCGAPAVDGTENWTEYDCGSEHSTDSPAVITSLCEVRKGKDGAYLERNRCVALIAKMALHMGLRAVVTKTAIPGWSEDWHGCVYVELPTGQVSWHFHDSQAYLFREIPAGEAVWDGHTTPEKYDRVTRAFLPGGPQGNTTIAAAREQLENAPAVEAPVGFSREQCELIDEMQREMSRAIVSGNRGAMEAWQRAIEIMVTHETRCRASVRARSDEHGGFYTTR